MGSLSKRLQVPHSLGGRVIDHLKCIIDIAIETRLDEVRSDRFDGTEYLFCLQEWRSTPSGSEFVVVILRELESRSFSLIKPSTSLTSRPTETPPFAASV